MRINHNIAALNTYRQLNGASTAQAKSMEKLSSGLRINRAGDDAAGLAISEKMRGQIRGLEQAQTNAQDGISMIQTAEGALNETHSILQRMRELATQASNDTNTETDRGEIQKEINQLTSEINRIGNTTEFNTQKLLDGGGQEIDVTTVTAGAEGVLGQYTIDLAGLTNGSINVDGTTINFTNNIDDTIAAIQASAVSADYDITSDGTVVTFTQKIASDTPATIDSTNTTVDGTFATAVTGDAADAGTYNFDLDVSKLEDGQKVVIDSNEYVYKADGTGDFKDASELITAISNDADYTVSENNGRFTLTQTAGSATAPKVSIEADGFTASFQVGANEGQSMSIAIKDMRSEALGISGVAGTTAANSTALFTSTGEVTDGTNNTFVEAALDVTSHKTASAAITVINKAIESVSSQRSELGAYQNRLDHTINNLGTSAENLTAAESRIRDVDMAKEMMDQTKASILSQASQAMLAQANQMPQGVLQLLR